MRLGLGVLAQLLETARELNEPGEENTEYVRGQVNLICDVSGVPYAMDTVGDVIQRYITHVDDRLSGVLIALERATEN